MGLDAESSDLTSRIQARRRSLVLEGLVEPRLPGERVIHGRQPGAADAFDVSGVAQSRAAEMRAQRARRSDEVVEMDLTDYRAAADADETFEVGAEEGTEEVFEGLGEDDLEPEEIDLDRAYAAALVGSEDPQLLLRIAGVEAELVTLGNAVGERFDGIERGFVALATGLAEELRSIRELLEAEPVAPPAEPVHVEPPRKPWWKFVFG